VGLGCDVEFRRETSWFVPVIHDWESFRLEFQRSGRWWRFTTELASAVVDAARDRFFVDLPDFQSDMDTLSDLRGPEPLCLDLYTNPAHVLRALEYIFAEAYCPMLDEMRSILTRYTPVTTHWMGLASPDRHDVLQADFLALVSPAMAQQFVIPNLRKEAELLDRSIFHFDGPGALDKLDLLLDIEDLDGIQWVPGAGRPPAAHWLPMLKRIQARNKVLFLSSPAAEVKILAQELDPRGLAISVEGPFDDETSADAFVRQVEAWCAEPR
jgi:5-methyltetrahydrofolate--homocysteine methyltransferase